MRNFYDETIGVLERNGKSLEEVVWIGGEDGYMSKELFSSLADVNYDGGFGAARVAIDLIISGDGWWLERGEYDGSEWWEYKTIPNKPSKEIKPTRLVGGMWPTLLEMKS